MSVICVYKSLFFSFLFSIFSFRYVNQVMPDHIGYRLILEMFYLSLQARYLIVPPIFILT